MVISNMVMKFNNLDIFFTKFVTFLTCRLHSPAAWKVLKIALCKLQIEDDDQTREGASPTPSDGDGSDRGMSKLLHELFISYISMQ